MLTECPSCQSRYDIENRLVGRRGRRIRCSVCEASWLLLPPDARRAIEVPQPRITAPLAFGASLSAPLVAPPDSPITASRIRPPAPRQILPRLRLGALLRGAGVAAVVVGAMGAIGLRERIVRQVPRIAPAYAAIGLPVNLRGLEFRDIKSTILTDNGRRLLAVEGVIAQVGRREAKLPDLRVAVRDPSGREIYSWTTPPPRQTLGRGETTLFRARLAAPPLAGADVRVQFAEASSEPGSRH